MNASKLVTTAVLAAALTAVPAVDAKAPSPVKKGATYVGVTSQGKKACHSGGSNTKPCVVKDQVSKTGKRLRSTVFFKGTCADGNVYQDNVVIKLNVSAKGKYAFRGSYNESLSDGTKLKNTASTHGTFKRKGKAFSVSGDFKLESADVTYTDGTTTHCSTPRITFTAKPK